MCQPPCWGRRGRTPSPRGEAELEEGAKGLRGDQCRCLPKRWDSRTSVWPLSSPGTAFELFFVGGVSPNPQGHVSALVLLLVEKGTFSCRLCSSPIIPRREHTRVSVRVFVRVIMQTRQLPPSVCFFLLSLLPDTSECICRRWTPAHQTLTAPRLWNSRPPWYLMTFSESLCIQAC